MPHGSDCLHTGCKLHMVEIYTTSQIPAFFANSIDTIHGLHSLVSTIDNSGIQMCIMGAPIRCPLHGSTLRWGTSSITVAALERQQDTGCKAKASHLVARALRKNSYVQLCGTRHTAEGDCPHTPHQGSTLCSNRGFSIALQQACTLQATDPHLLHQVVKVICLTTPCT
jgi:hypothetical protein